MQAALFTLFPTLHYTFQVLAPPLRSFSIKRRSSHLKKTFTLWAESLNKEAEAEAEAEAERQLVK